MVLIALIDAGVGPAPECSVLGANVVTTLTTCSVSVDPTDGLPVSMACTNTRVGAMVACWATVGT